MAKEKTITYIIKEPLELNMFYMPFIKDGGIFIPTPTKEYMLGDSVILSLQIPGKKDDAVIEGKVVWITPENALHHVLPGIGLQFVGANAKASKTLIESQLDSKVEVGGYTYGLSGELEKPRN